METSSDAAFARGKRLLVAAAAGIAIGLAVAGTASRTVGGVVLVASWLLALYALHRLGRAGSDRGPA